MEPEVVVKRRGRKRKIRDVEGVDKTVKKPALGTRSKVLIGRYVKKEFDGSGEFLGKIVSYDSGLYRVDYEDGDCEDLDSRELKGIIVWDNDMDDAFRKRSKALDDYISKKYAKNEAVQQDAAANKVETLRNDGVAVGNGVELANADTVETVRNDSGAVGVGNGVELANADKVEGFARGGAFELSGAQAEVDSEASSNLSDYEQPGDVIEVESPSVPPPQLPPSSGNFGVPEEHVSHLLSVYSFLRSYSVCLFLSPFGLDEFVGSLNCSVHNTLLDAIHVALMRALKSHVEILSSEGSELASKCLRSMDWSLLDSLTWPVFIVQYLMTMKYAEGPEWTDFYVNVLEKDYYTLSAGRKLTVLQILCDDALNSAELRAEIDMREETEVGPDPDGVHAFTGESISRRVHPSSSNLYKNQEVVKDTGADVGEDGNGDECRLCGMDGVLVCCDGCPSSYHSRCIGVSKMFIPEGEWHCPECTINRNGPIVTRVTSLRGAEFFGIDPYEQVFLGSCDHLLVMKTSRSSELHIRYYSPVDIQKVLHALTCSPEYMALYAGICKGILQYWEIHDVFGINNFIPNKDNEYSTTLLAKDSGYAQTANGNGVAEYDSKDAVAALHGENRKMSGFGQQAVENSIHPGIYTNSASIKTEAAMSTCSANLQPFPSELNQRSISGTLNISENGNFNNKKPNLPSVWRVSGDGCLYMGSSFKPQAYLNVYIHGDFAASAAASLAILSSEEKVASQPQPSSSQRKPMSANYSLQAKAFSLAAKRFYWPNYEKKLVEVSRERCGWCLACQATVVSKKGCLLNAAASNAIKGAAKILATLRQSRNVEASLAAIATYVMFMEESLCGLTLGPFLNASYRNQWHKQVEEAATLGEIKAFLLEFESNIRDIAFSADWIRLVDDLGIENQVTQNPKSVVGSTQKRGPGRRGRKPSIVVEVPDADGNDIISTDFAWWRGGMLSKHIFQKGILPQKMIKHAARHGGCGKINGVQYVDGLEIPKRSRQFLWRAAVEMSKTASQLAIQVRYLDLHVRWNELVPPEQPLQDGKGPEAEASAFRNACIVDKRIVGNKITYGVVFEKQKHLPSRVMKNILEVEKIGVKDKYWFVEMRIPLYLIKEYESKAAQVILPTTDKHVISTCPSLHKKHSKASGKNIFSFLSQKRDNQGKCLCTLCQFAVPFRIAAKCSACQGYCHEQCAFGSYVQTSERVEFLITCKRCYHKKDVTPTEIVGDSPTSPLLLQGQESQHPTTAIKGVKQNGYENPLENSNQSYLKNPKSNHSKISKSGKQNGKKYPSESVDQSSEKKKLTTKSSSKGSTKYKNKLLSLGLIWKKKPEDSGAEFRLNNLLLKDFPNGHLLAPTCHLCSQPYNPGLMYIRCEKCIKWFHADSVKLDESKLMELVGFKCCRCRRIRIPICPYTDPETRKKLEAKRKALSKSQKEQQTDLETDSDSETNNEQVNGWELDAATPVFDSEEAVYVQEDNPNPNLFSFPTVDQVNDHNLEVDFKPGVGPGPGPKKLPVRRHVKPEKESECNFDFETGPTNLGNDPTPNGESSTPVVEWDVSANGFEDNMMFDYADLNYEDMEFEPQTYFSFNELLAADDDGGGGGGVQPEKGDPPGEVNPEQFQMGINYDDQEPMFSVESAVDMMPCRVCEQTDPCPDLFCQSCGLWIHQDCSPWDEDSSWEPDTGWKCGNCREWC